MNQLEAFQLIISLAALVAAVISIWFTKEINNKSNAIQKENNRIQKRILNLEQQREEQILLKEKKAELLAEAVSVQDGYIWKCKLKIKNAGKSTAKDIKIYANDVPISDNGIFQPVSNVAPTLNPGCYVEYPLKNSKLRHSSLFVRISWKDDDEDKEKNKEYQVLA